MGEKYELTDETIEYKGRTLYRIKALVDIPGRVEAGELGGWVESEENLKHEGFCWVYDNAKVYGSAEVFGDSRVSGNAEVYGDAWIYDNAEVYGDAFVYESAWVHGNADVYGSAEVYGNADLFGHARICGSASVCSNAEIFGYAKVCDGEVRDTSDIITTGPVGSRDSYTTFNKSSGTVCTGCFKGTIEEFEKAVKKRHGDSTYGNVYRSVIAMFKDVRNNTRK